MDQKQKDKMRAGRERALARRARESADRVLDYRAWLKLDSRAWERRLKGEADPAPPPPPIPTDSDYELARAHGHID